MKDNNNVSILVIANLKLIEQSDEKKVDATLYKQIIGSLRYICNSRSDINYSVGLLSRFMNEPRLTHMSVVKHILRYLKGRTHFGLLFLKMPSSMEGASEVWCDSDWCGDKVDRKSMFGYFFK